MTWKQAEGIPWTNLGMKNLGKCHIFGFDFSAIRAILGHGGRTIGLQEGTFYY